MLLERYRLMQSVPGYPYPTATPGFMAPPAALSQYLAAGSRYPPELLTQMGYAPYPYPLGKLPEHLSPGSAER